MQKVQDVSTRDTECTGAFFHLFVRLSALAKISQKSKFLPDFSPIAGHWLRTKGRQFGVC